MKRVLLTGATGFIGRHCLPALAARGYEIHATYRREPLAGFPGVTWHPADLLAAGQAERVIEAVRPTHLLHLAWYVVPGRFWTEAENPLWVDASMAAVQAFHRHGGRRVVVAGTCAEYEWGHGVCLEGQTPTRPSTVYGASKHALQNLLAAYARDTGLSSAWGRIFSLYGPHEPLPRLVAGVVRALLLGETIPCSHGNQVRDWLHVTDVADAMVALLDSPVTGPVNVSSGESMALRDVLRVIGGLIGRPHLIQFGGRPEAANDPAVLIANVDRLSQEVGWQPRLNLEDGLIDTIAWWRQHLTGDIDAVRSPLSGL